MKYILAIFLAIFLTACEFNSPFSPSKEELAIKNKELDNQKQIELAKIESQLENQKLELDKKELELRKEEILSSNLDIDSKDDIMKISLFVFLVVSLALIYLIYTYLNNKRKDKLKAYEDNLEKYFKQKQNDAQVQIANKIIDTMASGKLNKDQEVALLKSINPDYKEKLNDPEEILQLDIIEDKKNSKKKSKKKKKKKESKS